MKFIFYFLTFFIFQNLSQAAESFPVADQVVQEILKTYVAWNEESGKSIKLNYDFSQDTVAAYAEGNFDQIKVTLYRGLLKSTRITPDGLRMMLCHELGHNLGGSPRKDIPTEWSGETAPDGRSMMSSEGQADYYASAACFRQLVEGSKHEVDPSQVTPRLKSLCHKQFKTKTERQLCLRTAVAGKNMLLAVADFPISFETPDLEVAPRTLRNQYPSRQCRLDTILAGALCKKGLPLRLDFNNSAKATCTETGAQRPSCWYSSEKE